MGTSILCEDTPQSSWWVCPRLAGFRYEAQGVMDRVGGMLWGSGVTRQRERDWQEGSDWPGTPGNKGTLKPVCISRLSRSRL